MKVNNDTVFEANDLEFYKYEPPLRPMSCHTYLMTGPENLHLFSQPRTASSFEPHGNIQKCFKILCAITYTVSRVSLSSFNSVFRYCKVRNISESIFSESIHFSIIADRNIRV